MGGRTVGTWGVSLAVVVAGCSSSAGHGAPESSAQSATTSASRANTSGSSRRSSSKSATTSQTGSATQSTTSAATTQSSDAGALADAGLFDPTEVARVGGWLSNDQSGLEGYAYTNIDMYFPVGAARDRLVNSIVGSCAAFAPRLPNWIEYCEAIVVSQIVAESSYVPGSPTPGPPTTPAVVYDSYATDNGSNDPTVGLLQVRFSSTVHEYNYYAPISVITAIGCTWPAGLTSQADTTTFWRTQGGTVANLTFMEDPACNIPLATWYVFMAATGNGGSSPIYAAQYCAGQGVPGNVVEGLLSHLDGPAYPRPADPTNPYPAGIKTRFTNLLGGLPSPDPFGVTLSPAVSQFCN